MAGFLLSAVSVFMIPLAASEEGKPSKAGIAVGSLFWIGVFLGIIFYLIAWLCVREARGYRRLREKTRPGCICFCKTKPALVTDLLFIPMAAITIIGSCIRNVPEPLMLAGMSLMLLTFFWHFVLNGRVYRYCFSKEKRPIRAKQSFAAENDETDPSAGEQNNQSQSDREGV